MYDLEQKIEDYSGELFVDLGVSSLSEEQKADLYARVQEHFHKVMIDLFSPVLNSAQLHQLVESLDQEDYEFLKNVLQKHPEISANLEDRIEREFSRLKLTITQEQANLKKT